MTEEGARCLVRIDELKRLGPFPQEAMDEGGLSGAVRAGEEARVGMVLSLDNNPPTDNLGHAL